VGDPDRSVDLVVIGSGGGGLTAALTAARAGLEVLVVEKQHLLGGSTAMSGGVLWLPGNPVLAEQGHPDPVNEAMEHLAAVIGDVGPASSKERRSAFVVGGGEMIDFLRGCGLRFEWARGYSDYYSDLPGGRDQGRSLEPMPFDAAGLGAWQGRLLPGLASAIGMAAKTNELRSLQYLNRSPRAFAVATRVIARTLAARLRGRTLLTNGSSLVGQLLKAVLAERVEILTDSPFEELLVEDGRVVGARLRHLDQALTVRARRGVLLAAGGFAHNPAMRREHGGRQPNEGQWSVANPGDTGEVLAAAIAAGAATDLMDEAWWLPSVARGLSGSTLSQARQRPGAILVNAHGRRFVNEANSMIEVGRAMYANDAVPAWIITDDRYRRRYVNGRSRPGALPPEWIEQGLLRRADTLAELAGAIGLDPQALSDTVARFNRGAVDGQDPEFGRGRSAYNRCMGDPGHRPNPALGPLDRPPYYATELFPADVGTSGGLLTDEHARVLTRDGSRIEGLYATGNITASVLGRSYPGAGASIAATMVFGYLAATAASSAAAQAD